MASPALAQAPGALDPGVQLQEELRNITPPPPRYDPDEDLKLEEKTQPDSEDIEDQSSILLKKVRIEGHTVLSDAVLMRPFAALVGGTITFQQLQQAALQAEALYKELGFITTRVVIPSQDFDGGEITIQVVEGFIQDVDVRGATPGLQAYVRRMLQPVGAESNRKVFNFNVLERQLLLIRSFGGVRFNSSLVKGTVLGGSRLIVNLKADSFAGGIDANNNIPLQLGDWQISANASTYIPISQPIKILGGGSYSLPFNGGLVSGLAALSTPIGNEGFKADAFWALSTTSSKDLLDGPGYLQTVGSSNYWSFGLSYPLLLKRNAQLNVSLQGTGQNSTNDLYVDGIEATDLSTDRIRALRLLVDGYLVSRNATTSASLRISQGLGGLDDGLDADEFPSNPYGAPNFTTARLNLARTQRLFESDTLLTIKGAGQVSATPLPVPETFTYGGPQYGRAFRSVYILGDQGWAGSVELAQNFNVQLFNELASFQPFLWYDYGNTIYKEGPLPSQQASTYGIGLKGSGFQNTSFELGWGIPATNTLQPNVVGTANSIVYFNVGWRF